MIRYVCLSDNMCVNWQHKQRETTNRGKKGHEKGNFNHFIWKWNKNKAKQSENTLRAMDFTLWEQKNIQHKVGLLVLSNTIRFCSIVDFTLLK